jgi:hypothetical protein
VQFAPTAAVAYTGAMNVTTTAGALPAVALSGTGQAASATISPTTLAFANTQVGSTRTLDTFVTNTGVGTITVNAPTFTGDPVFTVLINTCGLVGAGNNCLLRVQFAPTAAVAYTGAMNVTTTAGALPAVALSGTG